MLPGTWNPTCNETPCDRPAKPQCLEIHFETPDRESDKEKEREKDREVKGTGTETETETETEARTEKKTDTATEEETERYQADPINYLMCSGPTAPHKCEDAFGIVSRAGCFRNCRASAVKH